MNIHFRGPQKSDLLELLTQIRQGKVSSNIYVRLERLQVFILSDNSPITSRTSRPQSQLPVLNISIF